MTKLGVAILAVLASAAVVAIWGSGTIKAIAIALVGVIVLMLLAEGMSGETGEYYSDAARKQEVLGRNAKKRRFHDG